MNTKTHTYEGTDATVTWDQKRCIHFEACVHGLPNVFDPDRRPWIEPNEADTDALLTVIRRCPTGALHLRLADGTDPEPTPTEAHVRVAADGPLYLEGDVLIQTPDGETLLRDTRVALCRCGLSTNKPLCDGSHENRFADSGTLPDPTGTEKESEPVEPTLTVVPRPDGPLLVQKPVTVVGADGGAIAKPKAAFCRCGHSQNKPYCDGSHRAAGFEAP